MCNNGHGKLIPFNNTKDKTHLTCMECSFTILAPDFMKNLLDDKVTHSDKNNINHNKGVVK
ncbi:MAG: hypothetical protein H8D97_00035 [Proteobacteria bacterium]|nr:hypothetical protein [Pseudomonadota bacterium]